MEIINVIEVMDNNNISIDSFPVYEEQLKHEVVEKAEELFTQKALENGANEEDLDSYIEEGYYEPALQPLND